MQDFHTLLILMVIVWVSGKIFRAISLPVVLGQLLGGIIVGPLVLGVIDPDNTNLKLLADLGIFFLMLHSGLETHPGHLLKASKKSVLIAIMGILIPLIAIYFVARYFNYTVNESLFLGMGLSITALAITIRIFKDYHIQKTKTAHTALGAAIISDILGLMFFSIILNIIETGNIEFFPIIIMLIKLVIFFGIVIFAGIHLSKYSSIILKNKGFTMTMIIALALGIIAERIGLHIIIGAFLAGLFISEEVVEEEVYKRIEDRIYGLSYSFLGPIFFTSLAIHIDFTALYKTPWVLAVIFLVSILTKVIASGGAALLQKIKLKQAFIIGLAMNSRGAIDLVIASIGLEKGIIGQELFSILVAMIFLGTLFSIFSIKPFAKYAK